MSDGVTDTPSPGEQQTVPVSRLSEEIAARRRLEAETAELRGLLKTAIGTKTADPVPQIPREIEALREENPGLYKAFMAQRRALQEQSMNLKTVQTHQASLADAMDRDAFLRMGKDAERMAPKVEQMLNDMRAQGITAYNRGQIYFHLKGVEAAEKERSGGTTVTQAAQTAPVAEAPSQNARVAGSLGGGQASTQTTEPTLEELEKLLSDKEF